MRHFAYPNVRRGAFHGCGRFLACAPGEEPPSGYTPTQPNIGNLAAIREAILLIAPEWRTHGAMARVYEKRDLPEVYQGDSLALAYLLASIGCVRPLTGDTLTFPGDIWCTGAVRLADGQPFLHEVDLAGFDAKLQAFVEQSQDRLFFVPTVNLSYDQHALCCTHQVEVLSLAAFREVLRTAPPGRPWSQKRVVTVEGTELPLLVDTLFRSPPLPLWHRPLARRTLSALLVLIFLGAAWWVISDRQQGAIRAVLRDELEHVLEALAGQVQWTATHRPEAPLLPQRPGETRAAFEDRARDEFARWIDDLWAGYQRFPLPDAVYAAQRAQLTLFRERDRLAVDKAYTAVTEARERLAFYRTTLTRLLKDRPTASESRQQWATLYAEETANVLTAFWFEVFGNWLVLQPEPARLQAVNAVWVPRMVQGHVPTAPFQAGVPGWQAVQHHRARLAREKADILARQAALQAADTAPRDQDVCGATPLDAVTSLQKAGWAYTQGDPQEAVCFLEQTLHTETLNARQRQYVELSLAYLRDPERFDGVLGVYLLDVEAAGAAARADLRQGDLIVRYNQSPVPEPNALSTLIAASRGAPTVAVEVIRDGQRRTMYLPGGLSLSAIGTTLVVLWGNAL